MTRTSAQRSRLCSSERGLALAPLASLAGCHPPHRWFCRGHRVFQKKKERGKHRATGTQGEVTPLLCVHVFVRRREPKWPYLRMENRDAASFFLIFLHSVGHLGGDARWALWETGGSAGGNSRGGGEEEKRGSVRNTGDVQVTAHNRKDV